MSSHAVHIDEGAGHEGGGGGSIRAETSDAGATGTEASSGPALPKRGGCMGGGGGAVGEHGAEARQTPGGEASGELGAPPTTEASPLLARDSSSPTPQGGADAALRRLAKSSA